ncbi:MAG: FecR family protein [Metallibacterium sp.]
MKVYRVLLATALALGMVGVAQANPVAMLYKVHGKVMVNQGQKFIVAKAGMPLSAGDRILVMAGSNASIEYGSGCTLNLVPNSSITVTPDCKNAQAVAATQQGSTAAMGDPPTDYTPAVIVGGVVVLAALVASGGGSSSHPISP